MMIGFRRRDDAPAEQPSGSAFEGVDLTGWKALSDGVIWHGTEAYYRVTATADVIHVSCDDGVYIAGINWGKFSENEDLDIVLNDIQRVAEMNGGWADA